MGSSAAQPDRIHHFVPGIGLIAAAGAVAIATRDDGLELPLSMPFGVGSALTLDEAALLVGRNNAYWASENFAIGIGVGAIAGAAALAAGFYRRESRT